jgi:hypothetical protein
MTRSAQHGPPKYRTESLAVPFGQGNLSPGTNLGTPIPAGLPETELPLWSGNAPSQGADRAWPEADGHGTLPLHLQNGPATSNERRGCVRTAS